MNYQKEIQARYSEVLADCYELYRKGQRCLFEKMPEKSYDCTNCRNNNRNRFCKANRMLKKLIRLLAEGMLAEGHGPEGGVQESYSSDGTAAGPRPQDSQITDEHIKNFKALNVAIAFSSPKAQETIWLVPERTGNNGLEFTPEDIRILEAAISTFNGEIIEAKKLNNPKTQI